MKVASINAAFQNREEAFDGVREDVISDIFFYEMVHSLMAREPPRSMIINLGLVGNEPSIRMNMPSNDRREIASRHARNVKATNFPTPLDQRDNWSFGWRWSECAIFSFAAHIGLINFDSFFRPTDGISKRRRQLFHGLANAVAEEPCRLHASAERPLKLARRDALLVAGHEVESLQPNMHGDVAGLEDGSDSHGELLPARVAFVKAGASRFSFEFADTSSAAAIGRTPGRLARDAPQHERKQLLHYANGQRTIQTS